MSNSPRNQQLPTAAPSVTAHLLAWLNGYCRRPTKPLYFQTDSYHQWLQTNADLSYTQVYSRYTSFRGKAILDIGCGQGGKLAAYSRHEARLLYGLDINLNILREAAVYLESQTHSPIALVAGDAHYLPFSDSFFDVVISDDGFDHFTHATVVLREMARVLVPGGLAFISFVPYGSPNCSHMNEYLQFPWHHVFWSRRSLWQALCLVAERQAREDDATRHFPRTPITSVFNVFLHHLSRLTFQGFCWALTQTTDLELVRLRKQSRDWARPLLYSPLLCELFTDAVFCVLRKKPGARIRITDLAWQTLLDIIQDASALGQRSCRFIAWFIHSFGFLKWVPVKQTRPACGARMSQK